MYHATCHIVKDTKYILDYLFWHNCSHLFNCFESRKFWKQTSVITLKCFFFNSAHFHKCAENSGGQELRKLFQMNYIFIWILPKLLHGHTIY
jgi:hypothetical protein